MCRSLKNIQFYHKIKELKNLKLKRDFNVILLNNWQGWIELFVSEFIQNIVLFLLKNVFKLLGHWKIIQNCIKKIKRGIKKAKA